MKQVAAARLLEHVTESESEEMMKIEAGGQFSSVHSRSAVRLEARAAAAEGDVTSERWVSPGDKRESALTPCQLFVEV